MYPLDQFISKLCNLNPATPPRWGSMNAQQMVEHLALTLSMSNGRSKLACHTPAEKLPKAIAFLKSEQPMPRNVQPQGLTGLQPLKYSSINEAISAVREELELFYRHFEQEGVTEVHPVFGELDHELWKKFHHKHFVHHLTQFGLIGE